MELPLVLDQVDLVQHQSLHEQLVIPMFFKPLDGFLKQIIELLGAIDDQQREIYLSQNLPSLRQVASLVVRKARSVEVLELDILYAFFVLHLEGLVGVQDLVGRVDFRGDCADLVAQPRH